MIKHLFEQRSEAWHDIRLGRVTGTRFKDLLAAKTTAAYQNLIYDITGELITGESADEDSYVSPAMERGIEMEPEAALAYEKQHGVTLESVGFVTMDEDARFHDWTGISPDRLHPEGGLVEIKVPNRNTHLRYLYSGLLPSEYRHQVQGQLFVTGLPWCDFVSYAPNMKLFVIRVYPDPVIFSVFESELNFLIQTVKINIEKYNKIN